MIMVFVASTMLQVLLNKIKWLYRMLMNYAQSMFSLLGLENMFG